MNEFVERTLTEGLTEEQSDWLLKSFNELSHDTDIVNITQRTDFYDDSHPSTSLCKAINFDDVAKLYCNKKHLAYLNSCDALYLEQNEDTSTLELYWIEFKNGIITNSTVEDIKNKITYSSRILEDADSLNEGYIDLSNSNSPELTDSTPDFNFGGALHAIGLPRNNLVSFEQEHAHFILVYNEKKKETLISSDIDAICDEIENDQHREFTENVRNTIRQPQIKIILQIRSDCEIDSNYTKRWIKEKLKTRGNWQVSAFNNLTSFFQLSSEIIKEENDFILQMWRNLSVEEYEDIMIYLEYQKTISSRNERGGYGCIINKLNKYKELCQTGSTEAFFDVLCGGIDTSIKPLKDIFKILARKYYLKQLDEGKYNELIYIIEQHSALEPLDFEGSAREYIQHRIEQDQFKNLCEEASRENLYDASFFLEISAENTIWPVALFRLASTNRFLYRDAVTYNRIEFYDKFINIICQRNEDRNTHNFARNT